ncbi:hypothetical protein [Agilicoccus flavus]|nr:hypothetical protein [Agilicoccus flavus]
MRVGRRQLGAGQDAALPANDSLSPAPPVRSASVDPAASRP